MVAWAAPYGRPLLGVRRADTRAACAELGLTPWEDPHNLDPRYTRVRVRTEVLPLLEDVLGGGVAESLARTAASLRADNDALDGLAPEVTAVVSLCRIGTQQIRQDLTGVGFRLIDSADPEANPNLDFVLRDAARTVADLRDEGHVVFLHCVAGQSRTPTVAAAYAMLRGVEPDRALREVCAVLPDARPNSEFRRALRRLA